MSLYVIDDHPLVRQAIGMLLRRLRPASKVVELEKLSELQAAIIKHGAPELFVLDLLLPGVKGATGDDEAATAPGDTKLSKRQKQLILMLDRGLSNRDIASELNISEHTVKVHLWRLFRRLGVKSRTQTLHFARTHGLLMG